MLITALCVSFLTKFRWSLSKSLHNFLESFYNDNGNTEEKVTWKQTFAKLWLFSDYLILFKLYNTMRGKYATAGLQWVQLK